MVICIYILALLCYFVCCRFPMSLIQNRETHSVLTCCCGFSYIRGEQSLKFEIKLRSVVTHMCVGTL